MDTTGLLDKNMTARGRERVTKAAAAVRAYSRGGEETDGEALMVAQEMLDEELAVEQRRQEYAATLRKARARKLNILALRRRVEADMTERNVGHRGVDGKYHAESMSWLAYTRARVNGRCNYRKCNFPRDESGRCTRCGGRT